MVLRPVLPSHKRSAHMGGHMRMVNTNVQPTKYPVWEPVVPTFEVGKFLTVTGVLTREGTLSVEPGFHVAYRRNMPLPELNDEVLREAIVLEFLDKGKG